jgi:glc operon protein GlcG
MRILQVILLLVGAALGGASYAQQIPGPYGSPVTLAQARAIVDAAHIEAKARNATMAFAVVLPSGEPILLEVMDGTQSASISVAPAKARTAARYRRSTKVFADAVAAGNGVALTTLQDVIAFEGGLPILADGRVIGAFGVSGGTTAQDAEVAAAAIAAAKIK